MPQQAPRAVLQHARLGFRAYGAAYCASSAACFSFSLTDEFPTCLSLQVILVLTTLRKTTAAERSVRRGEWTAGGDSVANKAMGVTQVGRTIGILGMGSIGRIVGRYLAGMGMRVIYHNRRQLSAEAAEGAEYVAEFDEVRSSSASLAKLFCTDLPSTLQFLKQCDVLSIHVPLTPASHGLIGERELALLPPKSYVINTARGPVLNTPALIAALKSGHVAGAGLDVFDQETSAGIDPWLLSSDKVTLTPHFACNINSIFPSVESEQAENLRSWAAGKPVNVCNRWD